jgi:hypothetical protein
MAFHNLALTDFGGLFHDGKKPSGMHLVYRILIQNKGTPLGDTLILYSFVRSFSVCLYFVEFCNKIEAHRKAIFATIGGDSNEVRYLA